MSDSRKENYTKRHRNGTQDDHHPKNLDDGPLTTAGSHSRKGDLERRAIEEAMNQEAIEQTALPPSWEHQPVNVPEAIEKKVDKKIDRDLKRAEQSARMQMLDVFGQKVKENLDKYKVGVQSFWDKVADDSDDSKEAQAARDHFRRTFINQDVLKEMEAARSKQLAEDREFQQFRVYKRCHEFQQKMLMSKSTLTLCMAGRRSGKTEGNRYDAVYDLIQPDHYVLIICLTYETAAQLYWHSTLQILDELSIPIAEKSNTSGTIRLANGSVLRFSGNSTADEREKLRGGKWHKVIVDEVQSHKALGYLIHDIIEPMLLDFRGTLRLTGTGPRVRGTLWEKLWLEAKHATRLNWNLTQNPFIPDHEIVLKKILAEKGIKENDPLFVREYLGQIAYDDDALVMRLTDGNFYTNDEMIAWMRSMPAADIRFVGGLDYGHSDHDAFCIVMYSESSPVNWVIYQYKMNLEGIASLAAGIKQGLDFIKEDPIFSAIPRVNREDFFIWADTSDGRASNDLSMILGVNIYGAYKHDKAAAIDFLQDDVRRHWLKILKVENDMTPLEDEAMKTLFLRDDKDNLTRELDDDTYHADMIMALIYGLRSGPWQFRVQNRIVG